MKKILSFIHSLVSCGACRGMGVTDNGDDTKECKKCESDNSSGFVCGVEKLSDSGKIMVHPGDA